MGNSPLGWAVWVPSLGHLSSEAGLRYAPGQHFSFSTSTGCV